MKTALKRALPIVCSAYGEQFGVDIVVGGSEAKTNGKVIYLPLITDPSLENVVFGFLAHEAAHCRDTQMAIFQSINNDVERALVNIVEDVRIERAMIDRFPGTKFTLAAVMEYARDEGGFPQVQSTDNPATQLIHYLLLRCRFQQWGFPWLEERLSASKIVVNQTFPAGFFIRLEGLMAKYFDAMRSTRDAFALARAILKALEQSDSEERKKQSSANHEGGDETQQSEVTCSGETGDTSDVSERVANDATSDGGVTNLDSDGNLGESELCSAVQDASSSDAMTSAESSDTDSDMGSQQASESLMQRVMSESDLPGDVIQTVAEKLSSAGTETPYMPVLHTHIGQQCPKNVGNEGLFEEAIANSGPLRAKLQGLLQAESRELRALRSSGRRMDSRRLCRLPVGNTNVFTHRTVQQRVDTAVHLLIDRSDSMAGNNQRVANQAAFALALAMMSIPKSDLAVSAFPGEGGAAVSPVVRRGDSAKANVARFNIRSNGGTPMAEAMLFGARELVFSNRARKVLIVVTDGYPNDWASVSYLTELISGEIDVFGIGIASDSVTRLFKRSVVIDEVSVLQQALFSICKGVLTPD